MRIALLDMNRGAENRSIPAVEATLRARGCEWTRFCVRGEGAVPDSLAGFDGFISSGGPGDPRDGEGQDWERKLFALWSAPAAFEAVPGFLICHSFQLFLRSAGITDFAPRADGYRVGLVEVAREPRERAPELDFGAPGIIGEADAPVYALDSRYYETRGWNEARARARGVEVLATYGDEVDPESGRPRVAAIRIGARSLACQFHPEAPWASVEFTRERFAEIVRGREVARARYLEGVLDGFLDRISSTK